MSNVRFELDSKALDDAKKNFNTFQVVVEGSSKNNSKRHTVMQAAADAIAALDKLVTGNEQAEAKAVSSTPTSKTKTYAEAAKQPEAKLIEAAKEARKEESATEAKKLEAIVAQSALTLEALELAIRNGSQADPAKFKKSPFALIATPLYDFVLVLKYTLTLKRQVDLVRTQALKAATEANAAEIQSLKSQLETAKAARTGIQGSSGLEVKGENPQVADLQARLQTALDENAILVNENGGIKSRIIGMGEEIAEHDKQIAELNKVLADRNNTLQTIQDQNIELAKRNKSVIAQLEEAIKIRDEQALQIKEHKKEIDHMVNAAMEMNKLLEEVKATVEKSKAPAHEEKETPALVNAKVASAQAAANAANDKVKELEAQIDALKKSVPLDNVPVAREIAFQNESKEMHRRASVAETEMSRVAAENAKLVKELNELRATMAQSIEDAKADHIMNLELDIARLTKERNDARAGLPHSAAMPEALADVANDLVPAASIGTPRQHGAPQPSADVNDNVFHLPSSFSSSSHPAPQDDFSAAASDSSAPQIGENNPAPQAAAAPSRGWMGWMLASVVAGGLATVSALSMAGILTLMASNPLTLTLAIVAGVSAMLSARQSYASYPASHVEGSSDIANANNAGNASFENPAHAEPEAEELPGQSNVNDPDNSFVLPEGSNDVDGSTQQKITASLTDPNLEGVEVVVDAGEAVTNDNVVPLPLRKNSLSASSDGAHSDESPHVHFADLPSDSTKSTDDTLANEGEVEVPTAPVTPISATGSTKSSPKLNALSSDLHILPGIASLMSADRTSPLNRAAQAQKAAEAARLLQNKDDAVIAPLTPSQNSSK